MSSFFQCRPSCGFGTQTRPVTCQDSDGNISYKCDQEKPTIERQCKEPCLDNQEESGDSNKWSKIVDGQYVSVYIDDGGNERTHFANMTHLAEFLETSNSCYKIPRLVPPLLSLFLQGKDLMNRSAAGADRIKNTAVSFRDWRNSVKQNWIGQPKSILKIWWQDGKFMCESNLQCHKETYYFI